MLWGCFSLTGPLALIKTDGKIVENIKIFWHKTFRPVSKNIKMKQTLTFQHVKDPKHPSKSPKNGFGKGKSKDLKQSSQNPNLSPIKNLWKSLEEDPYTGDPFAI